MRPPIAFGVLWPTRGTVSAQNNLGFMYFKGRGVPQDSTEAMKWYRKAAEQSNVNAQFHLGHLLRLGRGVPRNFVQAYKWFSLGAARGHSRAILGRKLVAIRMTPAQIAEAQKLAREWMAKHKKK